MKVKKSILYFAGIITLILLAGYALTKSAAFTGNAAEDTSNADVQKIVLGVKNYNYYPNTIKVQANQPVRIYLDSSVVGCLRSFTIREFGIYKNLPTPQDYIEFTPTKKGAYTFACSMGMGTGTLLVE